MEVWLITFPTSTDSVLRSGAAPSTFTCCWMAPTCSLKFCCTTCWISRFSPFATPVLNPGAEASME